MRSMTDRFRYAVLAARLASALLVAIAVGALATMTLAASNGSSASAAYYGYCPDGSSSVYYCPPPRVPQHFKGYELSREEPVFPSENVVLEDQFVRETVQRGRPRLLLTPVEKRRAQRPAEPIERPEEHLKCWQLFGGVSADEVVVVSNQFVEDQELLVKGSDWLCAPALKSLQAPPTGQPADTQHYKCYRVREEPAFAEANVGLRDQFVTETVNVRGAELFCTPVTKVRASGERVEAPRPDEHLVCYGIRAAGSLPFRFVFTRDQFGSQRLRLQDRQLLCVPTTQD
jgi:hypothetical protein